MNVIRIDIEKLRGILRQIHQAGRPVPAHQIAAKLDLSPGTVRNILDTAERTLKVKVARHPRQGIGPEMELGHLNPSFLGEEAPQNGMSSSETS